MSVHNWELQIGSFQRRFAVAKAILKCELTQNRSQKRTLLQTVCGYVCVCSNIHEPNYKLNNDKWQKQWISLEINHLFHIFIKK